MGALSQGSAGGLPGMNLKAWVLMTAAGAIVKSFNVASITKGATGIYTVNFTTPMGSVNFIARCTLSGNGGLQLDGAVSTRAVGSAVCNTGFLGGGSITAADIAGLWEFYE